MQIADVLFYFNAPNMVTLTAITYIQVDALLLVLQRFFVAYI